MSAFESIKQGLEEAKEFSKGQGTNAIVHEISVPAIDVAEVRARAGLSQSDFAKSIGACSKNTRQKDFDGTPGAESIYANAASSDQLSS